MSKQPADLPERLRAGGGTNMERRLLEAAGREQPSRELSERMARALGVPLPVPVDLASNSVKPDTATAANASSSLVPWVSGVLVATCIAAGVYVAARPSVRAPVTSLVAAPALSAPSTPPAVASSAPETPAPSIAEAEAPSSASDELPPRTVAPQRTRRGATAGELSEQIALVDAARRALATGDAQRALASVREYQNEYPQGAFRPEVAAVRIEALVKLGRAAEARTLAERFVAAYGKGPLATRVARLAHLSEP